jgi:putative transposase
MHYQFDSTAYGHLLKCLILIDEDSRFCLAILVGRRCKAKDVVAARTYRLFQSIA